MSNPLRIPPLLDGIPDAGGKRYDLRIRADETEFFPDVLTPTLGVNGSYLGPTIRCRAGDHVTMRVTNTLDEPTTLHWHGLHVPARHDGGPHQVVQPGGTWSPDFDIKQNASLCWYHAHLMGRTGDQVVRGLAGLFLIEDDDSRALGLPSEYGVDDIPLIIQDRRFNRDGSFDYLSAMPDTMMGYKGNVILVNGTVEPYVTLRRQRTRLRILNASNSRIYTLGRDDGAELVVIGSDGGLLEQPVRQRRLRLGPGERAELLVELPSNRTVRLMSYPDAIGAGRGMMGPGMMMGGMAGNTETFPVIELRTETVEPTASPLPTKLIQVTNWTPSQAARTRTFSLDMAMMGMMGGGMMGRGMMGGGMMRGGMGRGSMGINGRPMNMNRIDERVPLGSIEIWEIRNTTPLAHPFHIHNVQFRILDRNGRAPLPHERGLKDTVLVDPGSSVRFITEFADYADATHPYMYHCHILEHEDAGMMGQFVVV